MRGCSLCAVSLELKVACNDDTTMEVTSNHLEVVPLVNDDDNNYRWPKKFEHAGVGCHFIQKNSLQSGTLFYSLDKYGRILYPVVSSFLLF